MAPRRTPRGPTPLGDDPIARIVTRGMSNSEFFERHAAAGRVGLVGGPDLVQRAIQEAQRKRTEHGSRSLYGHAFLCQGRRVDGKHWVLESDIDVRRARAQIGVQENRISKYTNDAAYPHVALLDFGLTDTDTVKMLSVGLDLVDRRAGSSLREVLSAQLGLKQPRPHGSSTRLGRGARAMVCAALVAHLFHAVGVELVRGMDAKLATPEDLASTHVRHTVYELLR